MGQKISDECLIGFIPRAQGSDTNFASDTQEFA